MFGRIRELDVFCAGGSKRFSGSIFGGGTYHGRTHDERRMAVGYIFNVLCGFIALVLTLHDQINDCT